VPIETRGAIGRYDAVRDLLELYGAAKVPHRARDLLALMLRRSQSSVHVHESHVGGSFGVRGELYPEDVLVCVAAMRLGRPVKWIEDRREHFVAANHSRQQRHKVRAGVDADGVILALDDEFWHDQGAYVRTHALRVATMISGILPGPYRIPAYRSVGHFRLTNKTPAATYRAPGRYETTFVRERLIEAIAQKLRLDPVDVRRRNAVSAAEMPFRRPLEVLGEEIRHDTGDYMGLLERVLAHAAWDRLRGDLAARRAKGELVGAGIAMYVEKSGLGPSDRVRIAIDATGTVEVVTGGASNGQGFETVIAQVAAETLGVDYTKVRVIHGQTDRIESGLGAHASRATVMTASATHDAALKVRAKALKVAGELMQAAPDELDIIDGMVTRRGDGAGSSGGGASMSLGAVVAALASNSSARHDSDPGLAAEGWHHTEHQVYPYGSHLAVVAIDRDTGAVAVERYVIGYDVGRAINPMLVEGQIAGGFVQGLAGALLEEFRYSDDGAPLAVTFADYLMPTAQEASAVEVILTQDFPADLNPLGIKGAGESGITAVGAAIANAVEDAIGVPGAITELPITPPRLREILARKKCSPD
jgi:CO/xanthine dehydrogenase Mo-binding subunit